MIPVVSLVSQTSGIEAEQTLAPVLSFAFESVQDTRHWALEASAAVWKYFDSSSAAGQPYLMLAVAQGVSVPRAKEEQLGVRVMDRCSYSSADCRAAQNMIVL